MKALWITTLLATCTFVSTSLIPYPVFFPGNDCNYTQCGINAECIISGDRPFCSCLDGYVGNPYYECDRVECVGNHHCSEDQICVMNQCEPLCPDLCGSNAICESKNHAVSCICPPGFIGDAFTNCTLDPQAPCSKRDTCGRNAKCEIVDGAARCTCRAGFIGNATTGCRHTCYTDEDCPTYLSCTVNVRCENPCKRCANDTVCGISGHRAQCVKVQEILLRRPSTEAILPCNFDRDCPAAKPLCRIQMCVHPCDGACGRDTKCGLKQIEYIPTAICSCLKDLNGNPLEPCERAVIVVP